MGNGNWNWDCWVEGGMKRETILFFKSCYVPFPKEMYLLNLFQNYKILSQTLIALKWKVSIIFNWCVLLVQFWTKLSFLYQLWTQISHTFSEHTCSKCRPGEATGMGEIGGTHVLRFPTWPDLKLLLKSHGRMFFQCSVCWMHEVMAQTSSLAAKETVVGVNKEMDILPRVKEEWLW